MHNLIWNRLAVGAIPLLWFSAMAFSQQTGKPKLIREPVQEVEEATKHAEEMGPEKPDPVKAKKNLEVGKYYFKRKNWAAAEDRFRISTVQNPKITETWELWSRSCEKQKKYGEAAAALSQYEQKFPESEEAAKFARERIRLEKKAREEGSKKEASTTVQAKEEKPVAIERP